MKTPILALASSALGLALLATWMLRRCLWRVVTLRPFEAGLLYTRGLFVRRLAPGRTWLFRPWSEVVVFDLRRTTLTLSGQEVLSADHVALKLSLALVYQVDSPEAAMSSAQSYVDELYLTAQLALRALVSEQPVESLLERRASLGQALTARVAPQAERLGLKLWAIELKDLTFPGELKKIFAEVVRARKEGQAALERARGETAALRSLANVARLLEEHPVLVQLRLAQSLAEGGRHSVMLDLHRPLPVTPATSERQGT